MVDYITLADGKKIDTRSGRIVKNTTHFELPTVSEAQQLVAATKRKLSELPSLPERMHPIALVLSYRLFGLGDDEIALALGWPLDQVKRIGMMQEYGDLYDAVTSNILSAETGQVRDLFTKHSRTAANKMVDLMNCDEDAIALAATKDILDRAGHRPADLIVENRNKMQADLVVKFVNDDRTNQMPMIDVTPPKENENVV
jgi:hypothetical protein